MIALLFVPISFGVCGDFLIPAKSSKGSAFSSAVFTSLLKTGETVSWRLIINLISYLTISKLLNFSKLIFSFIKWGEYLPRMVEMNVKVIYKNHLTLCLGHKSIFQVPVYTYWLTLGSSCEIQINLWKLKNFSSWSWAFMIWIKNKNTFRKNKNLLKKEKPVRWSWWLVLVEVIYCGRKPG